MVQRWKFVDPTTSDEYEFQHNPQRMTSPFREKTIHVSATTAVDGRTLITEGSSPPKQWEFGGTTLSKAHFDALRNWVSLRRRIYLFDHFGRRWTVYLTKFDAEPAERTSEKHYWRHSYTISAYVLGGPTAATVPHA